MSQSSVTRTEQNRGVAKFSDALVQMDRVTQENAVRVEESAGAASNLKAHAHQLVGAVAFFKLDPGAAAAQAADARRTVDA